MIVGIVGFGYIGSVLAAELAQRSCKILAYESNEEMRSKLEIGEIEISEPGLSELLQPHIKNKNISFCEDISELDNAEVILICVGTPLVDGLADLSNLTNVFESLSQILTTEKLIMVKSTVPPGTTNRLGCLMNNSKLNHQIAFSPERLAEGQALEDLRKLPIITGGVNEKSTNSATKFWELLGFKVISVSNSKSAELIKLADNAWIDLNIAFSHELAQICDAIGTDVLEVIEAANTLEKGSSFVNILKPSVGVGGYCLTKDPIFLHKYADKLGIQLQLSKVGRSINDESPKYLLNNLILNCPDLSKKKILILGIAFKNDSGDTRFSPGVTFVNELINQEIYFNWFDPLVSINGFHQELDSKRIYNLQDQTWDIIINLAAHTGSTRFDSNEIMNYLNKGGIFVDGRRFLSQSEIQMLRGFGFKYIGVGRGLTEKE